METDEYGVAWASRPRREIELPVGKRPTPEQMLRYCELLAEGVGHFNAARAVGSTASRFRALRNRDQDFDEQAREIEAQVNGDEALEEQIRGHLVEVALGHVYGEADPHPKAFEALKMLAEARLPEFDFRRTRKTQHSQDGPFEVLIGQRVDSAWLEALPEEELALLEQAMTLIERMKAGERPALRALEGGG